MNASIWIPVTRPSDGLELVDALARDGVTARLVFGAQGPSVRIVTTGDRVPGLLREAARLLEDFCADAPLEAA
jgi:hypothetical protein